MHTRTPRCLPAVAGVLIVLFCTTILVGCSADTDEVLPRASHPAGALLFADDEAALAAAVETLDAYIAATNAVMQGGGQNPEHTGPYSTSDWQEYQVDTAEQVAENGWFQLGEIRHSHTRMQQRWSSGGTTHVIVYSCFDYSERQIVDSAGNPADTSNLPSEHTFSVEMVSDADGVLRVSNIESWRNGC